jgi:hypothetical protein
MGFFKSLAKTADKLMSESVKKLVVKDPLGKQLPIIKEIGELGKGSGAAPAPATPMDAGTLSDDELTAEAQKRLARLGKYFTSPLGTLQQASTGAQRTFS